MTILFPIGGMSAKHLQKMVYKLPANHPVMCANTCVCYVCHHMKMYFIDFVCFFFFVLRFVASLQLLFVSCLHGLVRREKKYIIWTRMSEQVT